MLKHLFIVTVLSFTTSGYAASMDSAVHEATQKMRTTAYDLTNKNSLVVTFKAGSSKLSASDKDRIRALFKAAKPGEDVPLTLAAWSDKDFIQKSKSAKNATDADKKLAESRLHSIEDFLKSEKISYSTKTEYNMAKEPSKIAQLLGTDKAKVKESVEKDSKTDSVVLNKDVEKLKDDGGAHKAIIALPTKE